MSEIGWDNTGFAEDPDSPFASAEDSAVRKVLRKMGNESAIQSLRHRCRDATGSELLTFPWFHAEYPAWPVLLGVARVRHIRPIPWGQVMKNFTKTPMFKAFEGFIEDASVNVREESAGVIFMSPGHTTVVLHNYPRDDEYVARGKEWTRITRPMGNMTPRVIYTLEPLDALLYFVDKEFED
jgi:hypothetical protein